MRSYIEMLDSCERVLRLVGWFDDAVAFQNLSRAYAEGYITNDPPTDPRAARVFSGLSDRDRLTLEDNEIPGVTP